VKEKFRITLLLSFLLLAAGTLTGWSRQSFHLVELDSPRGADTAPLYLPDLKYVRLVTLGYDSFAGELLWFNLISYFGSQYQGNRDYPWLKSMCSLVSELNPHAQHVFEFCATILAWEAKRYEDSTELLSRAIALHPRVWRFRYLRGFNYWYFHEDREKAREDMLAGSKLSDAPPFLASIAARLMAETEDISTAIEFLENTLQRTKEPQAYAAIEEKLKSAYLTRDLSFLAEAKRRFELKHQRPLTAIEELIKGGIITKLPSEPFGGQYRYENQSGNFNTSSEKLPLKFFGKTAKTGAAKEEFQNSAHD